MSAAHRVYRQNCRQRSLWFTFAQQRLLFEILNKHEKLIRSGFVQREIRWFFQKGEMTCILLLLSLGNFSDMTWGDNYVFIWIWQFHVFSIGFVRGSLIAAACIQRGGQILVPPTGKLCTHPSHFREKRHEKYTSFSSLIDTKPREETVENGP